MKRAGEFMPQERRRPTKETNKRRNAFELREREREKERVPAPSRRNSKGTRRIKRDRADEMPDRMKEKERRRTRGAFKLHNLE